MRQKKIEGKIKKDRKTKNLIKKLNPGDIALICHKNIDEVAAESLIKKKIKAVINTEPAITGEYPNKGPEKILKANIPVIDNVGEKIYRILKDGDKIKIINGQIFLKEKAIATGRVIDEIILNKILNETQKRMTALVDEFIENTITYAKKEKWIVTHDLKLPEIETKIKNKHVLIAVRGKDYLQDLKAIKSYIEEVRPVLIGVDGGGDALLESGFVPDILIGDMDSVSDKCLKNAKEIIVHAYQDGKAPGLNRISQLGLSAKLFPCLGTSEDVAMLLAYEKGAELIVAVGTHTNIIDFLEKGRKGMASTFLVRLKIGSKLVDAKGVNKLYKNKVSYKYLFAICLAALWPIIIVGLISPHFSYMLRLVRLKLKVMLGF
jgi:uncharacterized membrane-anchored protein